MEVCDNLLASVQRRLCFPCLFQQHWDGTHLPAGCAFSSQGEVRSCCLLGVVVINSFVRPFLWHTREYHYETFLPPHGVIVIAYHTKNFTLSGSTKYRWDGENVLLCFGNRYKIGWKEFKIGTWLLQIANRQWCILLNRSIANDLWINKVIVSFVLSTNKVIFQSTHSITINAGLVLF